MKPEKLVLARKMAKNPTPTEAALWERLKDGQLGVRFLYQERTKGYIADFYCEPARLVVEVDGPIHKTNEVSKRDALRDGRMEEVGLSVLRLPTDMTIDEMVERIDRKLHYLQVPRRYPEGGKQQKAA